MRLPSTSPHLPSEHALREELRLFLCEEVLPADTLVHDDQPLVEVGVDSFALMEILLFVERRHGWQIDGTERTTTRIADFHSGSYDSDRLGPLAGPPQNPYPEMRGRPGRRPTRG